MRDVVLCSDAFIDKFKPARNPKGDLIKTQTVHASEKARAVLKQN